MASKKRSQEDELLQKLGRLRPDQKRLFLDDACSWLHHISEARKKQEWSPGPVHYQVLVDLIKTSRALALALERVSRSGIPEAYMRDAWDLAAAMREAKGTPFPIDLWATLDYLALSARIRLPDPNPRHRPLDDSLEAFLLSLLAERFHSAFSRPPTLGTNSPFVKFCMTALPLYGFRAPSLPLMKRILGGNR